MDILPISKVREEDAPLFGTEIVNLAKLSQAGFPIGAGIVIAPPEFRLKTLLKHFNLKEKEIFEQSLTIIKKETQKIPIPQELEKALAGKKVKVEALWQNLLKIWLEEIRGKVWNQGISGSTLGLSSQTLFYTNKIESSGKAFFDPLEKRVVFEINKGALSDLLRERIEKVVIEGNKRLFLPQVYHWIMDGKTNQSLKIVKIVPFTNQSEPLPTAMGDFLTSKKTKETGSKLINATKVFIDLSEGLVTKPDAEGVLLCSEKIKDFDAKVFKLVESCASFPSAPVIFKLSDLIDKSGGVRGVLRLIHQKNLLREDADVFLFARNKKGLLNCQLCIPFVRSVNEFLQIKRDLASLGISRKATLKIWMEASVPENVINLEEYLSAGLDGVIFNLDELSSWLGGFDQSEPESVFYSKQILALQKFLEESFKVLHKLKIPMLFSGSLSTHTDILGLAIEKGIFGVVADLANSNSLNEHLKFLEERRVRATQA